MKPILLFAIIVLASGAGAQNSSNAPAAPTAPTPIVITRGQPAPDTGVVLQELSPPQRPGRLGGVYITGAPPTPPPASPPTPLLVRGTNIVGTNAAGATGSTTGANVGTGGTYETQAILAPKPPLSEPGDFIFVPTLNNPGIPGAPGGRGASPTAPNSSTTTSRPINNSGIVTPPPGTAGTVAPLGAPAGTTATPAPPPGLNTLPGDRIVTPPRPITTTPPPISGPAR